MQKSCYNIIHFADVYLRTLCCYTCSLKFKLNKVFDMRKNINKIQIHTLKYKKHSFDILHASKMSFTPLKKRTQRYITAIWHFIGHPFLNNKRLLIHIKHVNKVYEKLNCAWNDINTVLYFFGFVEFSLMKSQFL
jgi:hypothetical protein